MAHARCIFCGKFIGMSEFERRDADGITVFDKYPNCEPSREECWHIKCGEKHMSKLNNSVAPPQAWTDFERLIGFKS